VDAIVFWFDILFQHLRGGVEYNNRKEPFKAYWLLYLPTVLTFRKFDIFPAE
jgi:hypothetical protein